MLCWNILQRTTEQQQTSMPLSNSTSLIWMSLHYNLLADDYILVELHDLSEESIPAIDFSCFEQTTCKLILSFATEYILCFFGHFI